jgi:hypothetical protein
MDLDIVVEEKNRRQESRTPGRPSIFTEITLNTLEKLKNRIPATVPLIKPMEFAELLSAPTAEPPTLDIQRSSPACGEHNVPCVQR